MLAFIWYLVCQIIYTQLTTFSFFSLFIFSNSKNVASYLNTYPCQFNIDYKSQRRRTLFAVNLMKKKKKKRKAERLTFAMALICDGNGATCAAGGESQVAGTLVGVSVGPADGARAGDLVRGRLRAPAGAPHTVRAQVLVQQTAPTLAAPDPCARTCSTLYTLLRTVVNCPRDRRFL